MFGNGFGYDFVLGWQFCALARAESNRKLAEACLAASKTAELKIVKPFGF